MITQGSRGEEFWRSITDTLLQSNLNGDYIQRLLAIEEVRETYDRVFTHKSADPVKNYEWLEILGDATVNKCVVWYISKRFPILNCTEGVKVIARLKINLISNKTFADFASRLNWWDFISAEQDYKQTKKKKLLEDVFEAFFGATELLIDKFIRPGAGYSICYRIIVSLFNELDISLSYESLYDPITRLKETFDFFKNIGNFSFHSEKKDGFQHVRVMQHLPHQKIILGSAVAPLLDNAKQKAALISLSVLESRGIRKPLDPYYVEIERIYRESQSGNGVGACGIRSSSES